jgi:hypothetical protein
MPTAAVPDIFGGLDPVIDVSLFASLVQPR